MEGLWDSDSFCLVLLLFFSFATSLAIDTLLWRVLQICFILYELNPKLSLFFTLIDPKGSHQMMKQFIQRTSNRRLDWNFLNQPFFRPLANYALVMASNNSFGCSYPPINLILDLPMCAPIHIPKLKVHLCVLISWNVWQTCTKFLGRGLFTRGEEWWIFSGDPQETITSLRIEIHFHMLMGVQFLSA